VRVSCIARLRHRVSACENKKRPAPNHPPGGVLVLAYSAAGPFLCQELALRLACQSRFARFELAQVRSRFSPRHVPIEFLPAWRLRCSRSFQLIQGRCV